VPGSAILLPIVPSRAGLSVNIRYHWRPGTGGPSDLAPPRVAAG